MEKIYYKKANLIKRFLSVLIDYSIIGLLTFSLTPIATSLLSVPLNLRSRYEEIDKINENYQFKSDEYHPFTEKELQSMINARETESMYCIDINIGCILSDEQIEKYLTEVKSKPKNELDEINALYNLVNPAKSNYKFSKNELISIKNSKEEGIKYCKVGVFCDINENIIITYSSEISEFTSYIVLVQNIAFFSMLLFFGTIFLTLIPFIIKNNQTIGKKIINLSVVTSKWEKPGFSILCARTFIIIFEICLSILFLGLPIIINILFVSFNKNRNAAHDFLTGTVVVDLSRIDDYPELTEIGIK